MKIVVLMGSPNKRGSTAILANVRKIAGQDLTE